MGTATQNTLEPTVFFPYWGNNHAKKPSGGQPGYQRGIVRPVPVDEDGMSLCLALNNRILYPLGAKRLSVCGIPGPCQVVDNLGPINLREK